MHPKDFLQQLDEKQIVEAIAQAESATSGEIRIFISHRKRTDALAAAQARFDKLEMRNTHHRNAVLIYIVPRSRSVTNFFLIILLAELASSSFFQFDRTLIVICGRITAIWS